MVYPPDILQSFRPAVWTHRIGRFNLYCLLAVVLGAYTLSSPAHAAKKQPSAAEEIKKHLLVVYNENAADARELAFTYATARNLDRSQIISIKCPEAEEITRDQFNTQIRIPIRQHMIDQGLLKLGKARVNFGNVVKEVTVARENHVWSIVLIRGIPLKIQNDATIPPPPNLPSQFQKNEAAVDSELSLIMYDPIELSGFIPNPYYTENILRPFTAKMALSMILVARLDGPSADDVRRMIRDAVSTEKLELTGRAYFDTRGITDVNSGYKIGDDWIQGSSEVATHDGMEVYLDNKEAILESSLPVEDIALYAGWYTGDFKGPFERADFRFKPGAVAYHLHSFSARTIRSTSQAWVGPLIAKGVTATMGSVYEPYLRLTPNVRTFYNSLLSGQCFAEAAYQSQAGLSWMITMVGDPLYRPFPRTAIESARIAQNADSKEAPWLCLKVARLICQKTMPRAEKIDRVTRMVDALPHPITYEGLGNILIDLKAPGDIVANAFRKAEALSNTPTGKIRNGLNLADLYAGQGEIGKSMAEYERLLASYPQAARQFNIPDQALAYAAKNGWNQFSTDLQTFLAPVGETPENSAASPGPETTAATPEPKKETPVNNTGIPIQPRKDLIPQKPTHAPPKSGPQGKRPNPQNPYKLP